MAIRIFIIILLSGIWNPVFGQYQVPLYAPGNTGGMISDSNNSILSVTGQNVIGVTTGSKNKVYLGLLAPVRFVLTNAEINTAGNTRLFQNYPNPFKSNTTIPFEISQESDVRIAVYNVLGQPVDLIVERKFPPGNHLVSYKADKIKPGMYFYHLHAGDSQITKTMVLTK